MQRSRKVFAAILVTSALLFAAAAFAAPAREHDDGKKMRWLKIRVYENGSTTPNVVVNVPVKIVELFLRAAAASGAADAAVDAVNAEMAKGTSGRLRINTLDLEAVWKELEKMDGQIIEVNDGDGRVSIFID
jgi:hypothetical protein